MKFDDIQSNDDMLEFKKENLKNVKNIKTEEDYNKFLENNMMYDDDFSAIFDDYSWCFECEKAFKKSGKCPYCDASVYDIWGWTKVRLPSEFRQEEYPEIPEIGKVYPLYNKK